jgi:environmental stress-induced protein Ves
VDRIVTVLEGAMRLSVADRAPIVLDPNAAPYSFPGDAACGADLIAPVLDLNLMVRREGFEGQVETVQVQAETPLALDGDVIILLAATGEVEIVVDDVVQRLARLDALRIDAPLPAVIAARSNLGARLQVLQLWRR